MDEGVWYGEWGKKWRKGEVRMGNGGKEKSGKESGRRIAAEEGRARRDLLAEGMRAVERLARFG